MNDQRSDDDRRTDHHDPEDGADERTRAPDETTQGHDDASAEPAADPTGTDAETETETGTGTDAGNGHDGTTAQREEDAATTDSTQATAEETAAVSEGGDADTGDNGDVPDDGDGTGAAPPRRRWGRLVTALALLIALAAAGAAAYLGWRLYELEQRVAVIPDEREAALEPLAERSSLQALERQFDQRLQAAVDEKAETLISARDEALGEVRERMSTLESGVEDIRELAARNQIEWRLSEIRYLLAIAQRRILIDRDTRSAIAALEAADRAIGEFGDVRLLPLRQRIVADLEELRTVEPADIEGIALRLQNLLGRVPELPAAGTQTTVTANGTDGPGGWWQAVAARLDQFVTVRRRDAGPERGRPQPATDLPEADRLAVALERARSAALKHDPAAYGRALTRASEALDEGFAAEAQATERFSEALAWLQERPVEVDLPDLAPTVDLAERLSARIESSRDTSASASDETDSDEAGPDRADSDEGED